MPLLKLEKDDPQKELEFEVRCALQIPASERLDRWLEWNLSMLAFIKQQEQNQNGHQNTDPGTQETSS
ncbi:MAG: hypothetical protein HQM16_03730 [Deltaproteobacteria bacterium]|nr:hypothetical protein [Deltaproteobacteria bacterium]